MMNESKLRLKHYFDGLFGNEVMNLFDEIEHYFSNLKGWTRKDIDPIEAIYFLAWLVQNELLSNEASMLNDGDVEKLTNMLLVRQYQLVVTHNLNEQPPTDELNRLISNFNSRQAEYKALWEGIASGEISTNALNLHTYEMIQNKKNTSGYLDHLIKFPDSLISFMVNLNSALLRNIDSIDGLIEKEVNLESSEDSSFEEKITKHSAIVAEWLVLQYSKDLNVSHNPDPIFFYCFTFCLCRNWYAANCPEKKEEFWKNFKKLFTNAVRITLDPKINLAEFIDDFFQKYKKYSPVIRLYINSAIELSNKSGPPSARMAVPDSTGVVQIITDTWNLTDSIHGKAIRISNVVLEPTVFWIMHDYGDLIDFGELQQFNFN